MTELSACADELVALVRDGRRIRLGARNFEQPHAELDELLARLLNVACRVRVLSVTAPAPVITGRNQFLVSVARAVPGVHVGPPATPRPGLARRILPVVSSSDPEGAA